MAKTELGNQLRELIASGEKLVEDGKKIVEAAKKLSETLKPKCDDQK